MKKHLSSSSSMVLQIVGNWTSHPLPAETETFLEFTVLRRFQQRRQKRVKSWCQAKDLCANPVICSRSKGIAVFISRKIPFSIPRYCSVLYICFEVIGIITENLTLTIPYASSSHHVSVWINRRDIVKPYRLWQPECLLSSFGILAQTHACVYVHIYIHRYTHMFVHANTYKYTQTH